MRRLFPPMIAGLAAMSASSGELVKKEDTELGFAIVGAIVQKNSESNVALIKEDSGAVKAVKRDFIILDKYKVLSVYQNSIHAIDREGKTYLIYHGKFMDDGTKTASQGARTQTQDRYREEGFERRGGTISVSASYRDKLVKEDLAKILMQATAEPFMENGLIAGFKMSQIDEGSIYAKAGLQDGDVVTNINGTELNNVSASISLLKSLKGTEHIDIELRRNGQSQKVTIDVK